MVRLEAIDSENFWDVIDLKVKETQSDLVTSNAVSIAQSKVQPECIPLAIYEEEALVGFLMYCIDSDDSEYWLYRLMIDEKYQGKGYSKMAMNLLLETIKLDKTRHKVYLGVDRDGIASVKLYEGLGFKFNGQVFGKEHIMVLEY